MFLLPLEHSEGVKWGGWRAGTQAGLQGCSVSLSGMMPVSKAGLCGLQLCISSPSPSQLAFNSCLHQSWGFVTVVFLVLFSSLFVLTVVSVPRIFINDY